MDKPNPTYLIEHMGTELRVTVTHDFNERERVNFTVLLPAGQQTIANLHECCFGRLKVLTSLLKP